MIEQIPASCKKVNDGCNDCDFENGLLTNCTTRTCSINYAPFCRNPIPTMKKAEDNARMI